MVGGYAVRYALDNPAVGVVTVIGRKRLGLNHPKLKEVLHQDFTDCSALAEPLTGQDAAIFCLGVYTGAVPDPEFRKITVNYTIEFARVLRASSPAAAFSFLSGMGADQTGRSRVPFARDIRRGREGAVGSGGPSSLHIPPRLHLSRGAAEGTEFQLPASACDLPVFRRLFPNQVIPADDLARAMVDAAVRGKRVRESVVLENREIRATASSSRPSASPP
jgi:uncharacterized protein YbjT (DUF2867 family)